MRIYGAIDEVVKHLKRQELWSYKSFSDVYYDSIKRQTTSFIVIPGSYSSNSPQESSGGRLGMLNFRVRICNDRKEDLEGDSAMKELLEIQLKKLLDNLCGYMGSASFPFQSVIFLTNISEPGRMYTDKTDYLRYIDCSFQVQLGL